MKLKLLFLLFFITGQLPSSIITEKEVYDFIALTGIRATKGVQYEEPFDYPPNPLKLKDKIMILARIINAEAEGESNEGQLAVGTVVMNRVKSNLFPNTIYEVVSEKKQFCGFVRRYKYRPSERSISNATKIIYGYRSFEEDVLFFKRIDSRVKWEYKYHSSIGEHDFYSL